MIVDIKDIDHVYKEIIDEIDPLLQKRRLMRNKFSKQIKTKAPYQIRKPILYMCPGSNISWTIYYNLPKGTEAKDVELLFITAIETPKQKLFINLNARFNGKTPPRDFLRVYSAHFLGQFLKRCEIEADNQEEILAKFLYDGVVSIFNSWDNKSNEMRYINRWGFSIGRYDEQNCMVYFDTFVRKDMLHKDQKIWVSELLNKAIKDNDSRSILLMYEYWHEYMDDEAVIDKILIQLGQKKVSGDTQIREKVRDRLDSLKTGE